MKVIGMLGGMSWESTASYYAALNEGVKQRLGDLHSAKIVLYSVDFSEIETLQHQGDWDATAELLAQGAQAVERAGADFLIICTNTMHKVAPAIQAAIGIPIVHIADATAEALKRDGIRRVGLLGTRFTMEQPFYRERLETHGLEVAVPEEEARTTIHEVIYAELCLGVIKRESKQRFLRVMESLRGGGAEAIILGCTEIALLVQQTDTGIPLYDTAAIHAERAVAHALGEA
ncbi:MAG: aspartate/glutamate racemase family protein [Candidatus Hydrogenedentota bacterium]